MAHPLDTISGILTTAATEYLAEPVAVLRPASKPTQINHEELPANSSSSPTQSVGRLPTSIVLTLTSPTVSFMV